MNKPTINEHSEIYRLAKKLEQDLEVAVSGPGEMTNIEEQAEILVQEIMDMVPTDLLELTQRDIDAISANLGDIQEDAERMQDVACNILENIDKIRNLLHE